MKARRRVKLARKIGFCFGVKRAIDMAEAALKKNDKVYSLGSIIHNKQVVDDLSKKGLKVVRDVGEVREGTIVISSHGISPEVARRIRQKGLKLIDTTCPFVLNAQRIAKSLSDEGYSVIIVGEALHPEVKALVGFASKDVKVVRNRGQAGKLKLKNNRKLSIISQTTQSVDNFLDTVSAILDKRIKELKVINTICKDVEARQEAARSLAKEVDTMLVVGGRNSANTNRLYGVCRRILNNTHLVESPRDIKRGWFRRGRLIGITSGASTPDSMVKKVVENIKDQRSNTKN